MRWAGDIKKTPQMWCLSVHHYIIKSIKNQDYDYAAYPWWDMYCASIASFSLSKCD